MSVPNLVAVVVNIFHSSNASSRPPPDPLERRPSLLHAFELSREQGRSQFLRAAALIALTVVSASVVSALLSACGSAPNLTPNPETYEERSRCEIALSLCLSTPTPEPTDTPAPPTPTPTRNEALMQSVKDTANATTGNYTEAYMQSVKDREEAAQKTKRLPNFIPCKDLINPDLCSTKHWTEVREELRREAYGDDMKGTPKLAPWRQTPTATPEGWHVYPWRRTPTP